MCIIRNYLMCSTWSMLLYSLPLFVQSSPCVYIGFVYSVVIGGCKELEGVAGCYDQDNCSVVERKLRVLARQLQVLENVGCAVL